MCVVTGTSIKLILGFRKNQAAHRKYNRATKLNFKYSAVSNDKFSRLRKASDRPYI